jgi:hypothetical protein
MIEAGIFRELTGVDPTTSILAEDGSKIQLSKVRTFNKRNVDHGQC